MESVFFDYNNLCVRCLFSKEVIGENNNIDWELWEFRVISSLISSLFYQNELTDFVLAIDSKDTWRKDVFPQYKEERKDKRDKLELDWKKFFSKMEELAYDLANHLPFRVMRVERAEADDIIAVLAMNLPGKKTIISSDRDFIQLIREDVQIYDPMKKQFMEHPNPHIFLEEQVLMGQNKHSIPNVKTPLDWPSELRKPGFGPKACEKAFVKGIDKFLQDKVKYKKSYQDENGESQIYKGVADLQERYEQNKQLMDLKRIPQDVKESIIETYNNWKSPDPDKIYKFFKERGWEEYLENFTRIENKMLELYGNEDNTIEVYV